MIHARGAAAELADKHHNSAVAYAQRAAATATGVAKQRESLRTVKVLEEVTLSLAPGEVIGLLGENTIRIFFLEKKPMIFLNRVTPLTGSSTGPGPL